MLGMLSRRPPVQSSDSPHPARALLRASRANAHFENKDEAAAPVHQPVSAPRKWLHARPPPDLNRPSLRFLTRSQRDISKRRGQYLWNLTQPPTGLRRGNDLIFRELSSSVVVEVAPRDGAADVEQRDDWHLTELVRHERGRGDPFAAAIRGTRMAMVITDPRQADNPIVFANQAFQTLTGYPRDEIIGRNCRFLQGPDTDQVAIRSIREAVASGDDIKVDLLNYRKDGTTFWNALYLSPVRGEDGHIQFFFASQLDVTDRIDSKAWVDEQVQARTSELRSALEAKTLLLHEVDHRVKNNLTMIGSLLRLQARSLADPSLANTLDSMLERVDALATVHRRLYQSDDITKFDIGTLAETLATDVVASTGRTNIAVSTDVERIEVPPSHASPIGLIINELLTNAVKHAYGDGRGGSISVSAKACDGQATIAVQDDGPGMSDGSVRQSGLGLTLINRLSRQVKAKASWESGSTGTRATLEFPVGPQNHESAPTAV